MVEENSIWCIFSAIECNTDVLFTKLSVSAVEQLRNFALCLILAAVKSAVNLTVFKHEKRVNKFQVIFSNASLILFREPGELKHPFSRLTDPSQWLHTRFKFFPLLVTRWISDRYRNTNKQAYCIYIA